MCYSAPPESLDRGVLTVSRPGDKVRRLSRGDRRRSSSRSL